MLYHVIPRSPNSNITNSSDQSIENYNSGLIPTLKLMPRYHYSRIVPANTTNNNLDGNTSKPIMTVTTTTAINNNNNNLVNSYEPLKSTFIPLVTNNRAPTTSRREFIQIPITREDGTSISTNNQSRSVPITYISQTSALPPTAHTNNNNNASNNNETTNFKANFTSLLRPNSKHLQRKTISSDDNSPVLPTVLSSSNIPRLPSVSRRLSLTIPVMKTTITTNSDDDAAKSTTLSPSGRPIAVRMPQPTANAPLPVNNTRLASAILRSSSLTNPIENKKPDIENTSSIITNATSLTNVNNMNTSTTTATTATTNNNNNSSLQASLDIATTSSNAIPTVRRAEVMAREAIQSIARLQQQQRNVSSSELVSPSPNLSRRVIINLKNNQSVSLDSRLSSAMKPPPLPSSSRLIQRNNFFHVPILHEIQVASQSTPLQTDISTSNSKHENYKNEFHMEIPVTITTNNDQENQNELNNGKEDGLISQERAPSGNNNSNQTLKSILKRSSSRENFSRKNVSFMNA